MNNIIKKPWGQEEILETNKNYTVKRLTMEAGQKCSLQYHKRKKETIYVISGELLIYLNEEEPIPFNPGEYVTIMPQTVHRMEAVDNDAVYLECSTSQLDDIVRIKDDYNRI